VAIFRVVRTRIQIKLYVEINPQLKENIIFFKIHDIKSII